LLQFGASAQNETVVFRSFYDSLSYALGVENGVHLFEGSRNMESLDKFALVRGFQSNLFGEPVDTACVGILENFLGRTGSKFNTEFLKEGSTCIGSFMGMELYNQMKELQYLEDLNMSLVLKGFKQGVFKEYTKQISSEQKDELIARFVEIAQSDFDARIGEADARFWNEVLKNPNLQQVGETGIYFETIEQGTGGKPNPTSDVQVHYILTNTKGDTLESSYVGGSSLKINLTHVIAGWSEGFLALEKGGKYRLFVPWEKAYKGGHPDSPQGALCFFVEFIDFGDAGTLARPLTPY
jgi:FKBP-type peptidyl-prolyl cis-trans isomerase